MIKFLQCLCFLAVLTAPSEAASGLIEPRLTLPLQHHAAPRVALTLDACEGKADERILAALIANRIPATVFVTARWLARNAPAVAEMKAHADLFEIENHGARHVPAVDYPTRVFGLAAAGSPQAVAAEIAGGAAAVQAATGRRPAWYRGATGKYSASALAAIAARGEHVAGYSLIADQGALLGSAGTARNIENARSGDVIIAHLNQPSKPAGLGVIAGVLALKARGFVFVRLQDALPPP